MDLPAPASKRPSSTAATIVSEERAQMKNLLRAPVLGGIVLAAIALSCAPEPKTPFDVLIYVLDACRPDRMGAYGYPLPTTPTIDALAADAESVIFDRHYVAGTWTKPATASLFTGKYVHQHGVTDALYELAGRRYRAQVLADEHVTLAESLQKTGFATYGLVTSDHLAPRFGFDQGFDEYFDPDNLTVGDSGRISKSLKLIMYEDLAYFAYIHQNAYHSPLRHEDRDSEFMAAFDFGYDEESRAAEGIDFTTSEIVGKIRDGESQLTSDDTRFLSLAYDAKLRTVDRTVVAPMIEGLQHIGRWDRTLLIVTADHGDELYEHGDYAHGHALWEEVIHVPLIVKFPLGMRPAHLPKRVDTLTSNVDFYPALLDFLDRPALQGLVGQSLFGKIQNRFVLSQGYMAKAASLTEWAVLHGREKLLVENRVRRLFDLETDPGETHDLADSRPERVTRLAALGEATLTDGTAAKAPEIETDLSLETIERLQELGYLE